MGSIVAHDLSEREAICGITDQGRIFTKKNQPFLRTLPYSRDRGLSEVRMTTRLTRKIKRVAGFFLSVLYNLFIF